MMRMLAVTLGALFQVAAVSCLSFCPAMLTETLRNVVVAGNNVIVGSSSTLYRLTTNMVEVESVMLGSPCRLLVAERTSDEMFGGTVLVCGTTHCNLSLSNSLSEIFWQGPVLESGMSDVLAVPFLTNSGNFSVTYGTKQSQRRPSTITRGSLLNSFDPPPYTFMQYAEQREPNVLVTREFLTVFSNEGYQYFIVSINNQMVITRLCVSDNGNQQSPISTFASHFELELKCANFGFATAATFVSTEVFGVETVLLAYQVIPSGTFYICAFNLSEINERMDQKFETCTNGIGMSGFQRDREVPCPTLLPEQIDSMDISTCNLGPLLPGLESSLEELFPLLSLEVPAGVSSMTYTEYLFDSSHYLFLGTSAGKLYQVLLINSTYAEVVREVRIVSRATDITQLVPSDGGDYIYALTARQLLQVPVDRDERISLNVCETPSPTPVESPPSTYTMASSHVVVIASTPTGTKASIHVDVIASSVTAGAVGCLVIAIVVVALIVTCKKHKKTKQKLKIVSAYAKSKEEPHVVEEEQRYSILAQRMLVGSVHITESVDKLPQQLVIPNDQIQLLDSIGQGEFGIVYKAHLTHWRGPHKVVAVKTLKGLFTVKDVHNMTDEILKMKHFDHPNVMTLIGVCVSVGGGPGIVMPFMENGSLLSYLRRDKKNITIKDDQDLEALGAVQKLLLNLCLQVAKGMKYLTLQNFVHRDLAARNCMIDGGGVIKVADFGLAEDMYAGYFRQDKSEFNVKLPFKWMPLESLQEGLFSEKSDVWSFGVTCWEVFTAGKIPYAGVDPLTLTRLLEDGRRLEKPSNTACSVEIYLVMQSCWEGEAENRPPFCELVSTISSILESAAGYLELVMLLQDGRPEFQGSDTRADDDNNVIKS